MRVKTFRRSFPACCDLACSYCGLAVWLTDECPDHPGRGVVEQLLGAPLLGAPHAGGLFGLQLMHRFCAQTVRVTSRRRAMRCGLAARRARLGRATERYDAGMPPEQHDLLGLRSTRLANVELYRKYWHVRRMQYASKAWRYYAGRSRRWWQGARPLRTLPSAGTEDSCSFD